MHGRVLVTGASGLVGANLVRTLLNKGRVVRAMVHTDRRALDGLELEVVQADVRDRAAMDRAVSNVDTVYHLAGSISLENAPAMEMMAVNVQGTRNLVAACLRSDVSRLIHFSSVEAVSHTPNNEILDESESLIDNAHFMNSPYYLSKAQAEQVIQEGIQQGLNAIIIRPTAILGPYDYKPSYIGQALIQLANRKIPALVKSGFDWVDVRDVVQGAILAEEKALNGSCYLLSGNWHSLREVADMVADYSQHPAPRVSVPMWLAEAFAPAMLRLAKFNGREPLYTKVTLDTLRGNRHVSSAKAREELGYNPRPLRETICDTLEWFRQNHYLGEVRK